MESSGHLNVKADKSYRVKEYTCTNYTTHDTLKDIKRSFPTGIVFSLPKDGSINPKAQKISKMLKESLEYKNKMVLMVKIVIKFSH